MSGYASYSTFYIGGSTTDYIFHISGYSSTARDFLTYNNLKKFTTKDNDNDAGNWGSSDNCAIEFTGAWWYNNCYYSNLNGQYGIDTVDLAYSLPYVEMKIRCV